MNKLKKWRGFDLTNRYKKITRAFNLEDVSSPEDVPLIINTPCYFAFGSKPKPEDYWSNPKSMVKYQANGFERHLKLVTDDTIPYFMPWFGTGVLASAFGCKVKFPDCFGQDPGVVSTCIDSPNDVKNLQIPNAEKDGLMPRVLEAINYARENSDLPPGLTDMNSPLSTVAQMCGYEKLFIWMHKKPEVVHDMFEIVTEAFIKWVKIQKKYIGEPLNSSNGLQGVWSPEGVGIWVSDDDIVSIGPELYEKFIIPHYSRIFETFGGGSVHFCGNGSHQAKKLLKINNIRVVNNSPLWDFEAFSKLFSEINGKVTIQIQDIAPIDTERYYKKLFEIIDDFRGVMLATFVLDSMGMAEGGGTTSVKWDPFETANIMVRTIRKCIAKKMAGEETNE